MAAGSATTPARQPGRLGRPGMAGQARQARRRPAGRSSEGTRCRRSRVARAVGTGHVRWHRIIVDCRQHAAVHLQSGSRDAIPAEQGGAMARTGRRCDRRGPAGRVRADTVFGIPGIHTLGLYDALAGDAVDPPHPDPPRAGRRLRRRRVRPGRRASRACARRRPGPGTFNTLAAVAEAWSDSSPVVLLARPDRCGPRRLGRGILHETPDQGRSFEALTAFVGRPRTTAGDPGRRRPRRCAAR